MTTKERPIIFSDEMVRAILDRRKTQTRRVVTSAPGHGRVTEFGRSTTSGYAWHFRDRRMMWHDIRADGLRCPYGKSGDRLWVRETWAPLGAGDIDVALRPCPVEESKAIHYRADGVSWFHGSSPSGRVMWALPSAIIDGEQPWRPSIHMPRWASRITLEVTDVRVERVQDLSEQDAQAEGVVPADEPLDVDDAGIVTWAPSHREAFAHLWDSINAKRGYGWASNPWVWVVGFKRVTP